MRRLMANDIIYDMVLQTNKTIDTDDDYMREKELEEILIWQNLENIQKDLQNKGINIHLDTLEEKIEDYILYVVEGVQRWED